jgi:hypothetical protein
MTPNPLQLSFFLSDDETPVAGDGRRLLQEWTSEVLSREIMICGAVPLLLA